jgi:hypothetical protein
VSATDADYELHRNCRRVKPKIVLVDDGGYFVVERIAYSQDSAWSVFVFDAPLQLVLAGK